MCCLIFWQPAPLIPTGSHNKFIMYVMVTVNDDYYNESLLPFNDLQLHLPVREPLLNKVLQSTSPHKVVLHKTDSS